MRILLPWKCRKRACCTGLKCPAFMRPLGRRQAPHNVPPPSLEAAGASHAQARFDPIGAVPVVVAFGMHTASTEATHSPPVTFIYSCFPHPLPTPTHHTSQ